MQRLSKFQCPLEDMRIIKYKNTALHKKESSLSIQSGKLRLENVIFLASAKRLLC